MSQKDGTTPAAWDVVDGAMQVKPKAGGIQSKDVFGSVQLHIEFATPTVVKGSAQGRGNSGVFLMNTYEIQVLDSYQNKTFFHGQAGSIYKQHKPLVNPIRKPGEWNVYEIVFHAPKFDEDGKLLKRVDLHRVSQRRAGAGSRRGDGRDRARPPALLREARR